MFDGRKSNRGVDIGLGVSYRYDSFNITAMFQALQLGAYTGGNIHTSASTQGADGIHFVFNMIPSYEFNFGTLGLSFIFQTKAADTLTDGTKDERSAWTRFGVGAWFQRGMAGGSIKAGFAYAAPIIATGNRSVQRPDGSWGASEELYTGFHRSGIFSIPIIFEYAFF